MERRRSLKKRIINYLSRHPRWFNVGEIEDLAKDSGYLGSNAGRRCRELVNEGILEKEIRKGSVWYKLSQVIN